MKLFEGQNIVLVGLGESGLACARWALAQGARLTVLDTRTEPPGLVALRQANAEVDCYQSVETLQWQFDRVVVSPGLAPSHPLMQAVIAKAQAEETPVESELDWFADALGSLAQSRGYVPQVIGITGTNGKTTTVRMVECLAHHAGLSVRAAGNISPAALASLHDALEKEALPDLWVLELSSFQLHWTNRLACDASAILNVSQDHLDWHIDLQEYVRDKARIFERSKNAILNRDDAAVSQLKIEAGCNRVAFGLSAPTASGDFGLIREGGMLWLAVVPKSDEPQGNSRKKKAEEDEPLGAQLLMPADALQVVGLHNAANALAALALCQSIGMPMAKLLHGLRAYRGEPHRVELVTQVEGIDFFDDSKGTNVGATVAALEGLQRPCVLIAGGEGKGQDFSPLAAPARAYCKETLLIGKAALELGRLFESVGVPAHQCQTLEQAVRKGFDLANEHAKSHANMCVLLSPACASLDMFKNYEHRAQVFVNEVRELAADRGQPC